MARYKAATGVRSSSFKNIAVNAGALYYNIDMAPLQDGAAADPVGTSIATAKLAGMTRGENGFTIEREIRQPEFNGSRGMYKDLQYLETVSPMLSVGLLEQDRTNLQYSVPGARAIPRSNGVTEIKFFKDIVGEDYLSNVALFATHGTRNVPMIIVLADVLNSANFALSFADQGEPVNQCEFRAHYDLTNDELVPAYLFMANEAAFIVDVPTTATAAVGASTTVDATFVWVDGYSSDVTVTVEDDPRSASTNVNAGITLQTDPVTVTGGTPSETLTLAVDTGVAAGDYTVPLKFSADDIVFYEKITFTVTTV